jgi:hypothetical protein
MERDGRREEKEERKSDERRRREERARECVSQAALLSFLWNLAVCPDRLPRLIHSLSLSLSLFFPASYFIVDLPSANLPRRSVPATAESRHGYTAGSAGRERPGKKR